jgi:hypothetical protein
MPWARPDYHKPPSGEQPAPRSGRNKTSHSWPAFDACEDRGTSLPPSLAAWSKTGSQRTFIELINESHFGETRPRIESLVLSLIYPPVPAPTSVGGRGRDGGDTAGAIDSGVWLSSLAYAPPAPQEVPIPQITIIKQPFGEGESFAAVERWRLSWPGRARVYQSCREAGNTSTAPLDRRLGDTSQQGANCQPERNEPRAGLGGDLWN